MVGGVISGNSGRIQPLIPIVENFLLRDDRIEFRSPIDMACPSDGMTQPLWTMAHVAKTDAAAWMRSVSGPYIQLATRPHL